MKISTLFYCFKQGIRNVFRNKWFSLASVATIAACLFLFGLFYAIVKSELGESKMSTVIAVLLGQFMGIIIILIIFYSFFNC